MFRFSIVFCALVLAGCNVPLTLNAPANFGIEEGVSPTLAAAPKPVLGVGDRYLFTNGARFTVEASDQARTVIRRNRDRISYLESDVFMPESYHETSRSILNRKTTVTSGQLWPLQVGRSATYKTDVVSKRIETGEEREYSQFWSCSVTGTARITVMAGSFDTYQVDCDRSNQMNRVFQKRTSFYAPDVGVVVFRRDYYRSSKKERFRKLMAVRPSYTDLERSLRNGIVRNWQETLENTPSLTTTSWSSDAGDVQSSTTPLSTFIGENDQYCRNYAQQVTINAKTRSYKGVACRESALRWRTPSR